MRSCSIDSQRFDSPNPPEKNDIQNSAYTAFVLNAMRITNEKSICILPIYKSILPVIDAEKNLEAKVRIVYCDWPIRRQCLSHVGKRINAKREKIR